MTKNEEKGELDKASTCKEYLQVAHEGSREMKKNSCQVFLDNCSR